jgi:hypothetical protein
LPVAPLLKKRSKDEPLDQDRSSIIDRGQAILEPVGDGILVHAERPRYVLDRVAPMNLHEPGIQPADSH